jgi:hypothetical protein
VADEIADDHNGANRLHSVSRGHCLNFAGVIAVAWLAVLYLPALSHQTVQQGFMGYRAYRTRPLEPRLSALPELFLQVGLTILGAFAARRLFRLHL